VSFPPASSLAAAFDHRSIGTDLGGFRHLHEAA